MDLGDLELDSLWRYIPEDGKILFFIAAALALVLCVFFLPEKRRANLGKALQAVHDFLNFKVFIIEKIFQFLYLALSLAVFFLGIYFFAEGVEEGLLVALLGPVAIRLAYEGIMLAIVLVKNVIQINKKMPAETKKEAAPVAAPAAPVVPAAPVATPAAPAYEPYPFQNTAGNPFAPVKAEEPAEAPSPEMGFCTMCGAQYDKSLGNCPKCGY